jgi:hypothetical protein
MFGRNGARSRPARNTRAEAPARGTQEAPAPSTLLTIVGQQSHVEGKDAHSGPRPMHLVEDMRQSAQK